MGRSWVSVCISRPGWRGFLLKRGGVRGQLKGGEGEDQRLGCCSQRLGSDEGFMYSHTLLWCCFLWVPAVTESFFCLACGLSSFKHAPLGPEMISHVILGHQRPLMFLCVQMFHICLWTETTEATFLHWGNILVHFLQTFSFLFLPTLVAVHCLRAMSAYTLWHWPSPADYSAFLWGVEIKIAVPLVCKPHAWRQSQLARYLRFWAALLSCEKHASDGADWCSEASISCV